MIGLSQQCGITDGDDLQQDLESQDKAVTLVGLLVHFNEKLSITTLALDSTEL